MHKTGTKEYMRAYAKKYRERVKADPELLARYKAWRQQWYQKHKQRLIDDPEYRSKILERRPRYVKQYQAKLKADPERWAEHKRKQIEKFKKWLANLSESERKARSKKSNQAYMNRIKSDPEFLEKHKQRTARAQKKSYEKRKARLYAQGLTVRGTRPYQSKPRVPFKPKPSLWEIKTGKPLQGWAEQLGVSREAVRLKFSKAQKTLTDSEQVFEQMRRTGEWPETWKFQSIAGVKK